ncbi:MAG: triose-phosphate isomerase, partial [Anaerolineales bacterium]
AEARRLVYELLTDLKTIDGVEKVLCPPATSLMALSEVLKDTGTGLGGQNLYWEPKGAFTGELAPAMIAEFCQYVIIGHSERRGYFWETDESVNRKIKAALEHNLTPIICVGETLEENQAGRTAEVVSRQVNRALAGLSAAVVGGLIIAYEPVWAIGTGLPATPEGANQVIASYIRGPLTAQFGEDTAQAVRVQYGGSVKPGNAVSFFSQPDIDGALVGGASLKAGDFVAIVRAAAIR